VVPCWNKIISDPSSSAVSRQS